VWGRTHSSVQRRRSRACGDAAASFEPRATRKTGKGTSSTRADSASKKIRLQPLRTAAPTIVGCNFFEINGVNVPEMGLAACRKGTPSPLDLWNHPVSGRSQIKSWRSITCGQNLDLKRFTHRARGVNSHNGTDALSAHRHGLDDDRKIAGLCARSDVTCSCGKRKLRSRFCPSVELPHSSQERA